MPSINHKISFVLLWFLVGIVHWGVGIVLLETFTTYSRNFLYTLFSSFGLLTVLVLPARRYMLSYFLGLRLEKWTEKTVAGTMGGIILAILDYLLLAITYFFFFQSPYYELDAWDHFQGALATFSTYLAFRFFLVTMQYDTMRKPQKFWLFTNLISAVVVWLTFSFHFAGFGILPSSVGLILPYIVVAISELLIAYSYIRVKQNELISEKRKVAEM